MLLPQLGSKNFAIEKTTKQVKTEKPFNISRIIYRD